MHNCKSTRNNLIEMAFDEMQPEQQTRLLAELKDCEACREEYASLRNALRVTNQALRSAQPTEGFWSGYHARLTERIENYSAAAQPSQLPRGRRLWIGLRKLAATSVRIPVPVAAASILLLGPLTFFVMHSRGQVNAPPNQPAAVQIRTVEVPVTHEKVVTRVVYVEKNRRPTRGSAREGNRAEIQTNGNRIAKAANEPGTTAMSLIGFKPTDQVKLKIMKGSYHDEK